MQKSSYFLNHDYWQLFGQDYSEKICIFYQRLNQIDWQSIGKKLIDSNSINGWNYERVETAIYQYKMFLCVNYLFPKLPIIPSQEIDEVWHCHILLDTRKYMQDCNELFGYVLHHISSINQRSQNDNSTELTQDLFMRLFGIEILNHPHQIAACLILP